MLNKFNKKINRIDRLSDFRKSKNLERSKGGGGFEIEVSPKTLLKLKKNKKEVPFSLECDFGLKEGTERNYWLRVNKEFPNKKTDFDYVVLGFVNTIQNSGMDNWGVSVNINHIDVSTSWGMLNTMTEMIAEWLDKKYGNNCGFKKNYNMKNIDFIKNKKR